MREVLDEGVQAVTQEATPTARKADELHQLLCEVAQALSHEVLFTKIWGSHSHDCALPGSDVDVFRLQEVRRT